MMLSATDAPTPVLLLLLPPLPLDPLPPEPPEPPLPPLDPPLDPPLELPLPPLVTCCFEFAVAMSVRVFVAMTETLPVPAATIAPLLTTASVLSWT